jgi:hypothetical protein
VLALSADFRSFGRYAPATRRHLLMLNGRCQKPVWETRSDKLDATNTR